MTSRLIIQVQIAIVETRLKKSSSHFKPANYYRLTKQIDIHTKKTNNVTVLFSYHCHICRALLLSPVRVK